MQDQTEGQAQLDQLFRALSDPTRRAILAMLREGPRRVGELALPFEVSAPAITKHLKILENADLVSRSVDGRVHTCTLNAPSLLPVHSWLESYRDFWSEQLDSLAEYIEQERDLE